MIDRGFDLCRQQNNYERLRQVKGARKKVKGHRNKDKGRRQKAKDERAETKAKRRTGVGQSF